MRRYSQDNINDMHSAMSHYFKNLRQEKGLRQSDVGEFFLVGGANSVSLLERGQSTWRLDQMATYAQAVGLDRLVITFDHPREPSPADVTPPQMRVVDDE